MNELKFNTQICTSIEQSKRLLELGLNPYTSDMCWLSTSDVLPVSIGYIDLEKASEELKFNTIPSWSLHRLIEILDSPLIEFNILSYNPYEEIIDLISESIKLKFITDKYLKQ